MNAIGTHLNRHENGLTLIEVLVTVLVMSIGLMGLAALQMNTLKESVDVSRQTHGTWLVDELAARMRVNQAGLGSGYTTAAAKPKLCETAPAKQCADYNSGSAKVNAANNCSANEMAEFDVWQVACGYALANIDSNNADSIDITDYDITCDDSDPGDAIDCSPLSPFTIKLTWKLRAAGDANEKQSITLDTTQTIEQIVIP
ncbi:type IV pilus modification protein PilV [Gilvimarinus sp. F26214L]|uniref:type IV pilus modification protein PilV n=1 Tax=Gilvimarinus sp. DZF01 TaxID=3461371 RepID=UPI0040461784